MSKNDGGPAFPCPGTHGQQWGNAGEWLVRPVEAEDGMTLRDWFAGQALVAIINDRQGSTVRDMADRAYIYADIMLEARGE